MNDDHDHLVTRWGRAHLCGPYWLEHAIDVADGSQWPMIADTRLSDASSVPIGVELAAIAPHEMEGPLPAVYAERLDPRCGRPRRDGQPCRAVVAHPGGRCGHHRDAVPTERTPRP